VLVLGYANQIGDFMDRVKMASELVKLAKEIVASTGHYDFSGIDIGEFSVKAEKKYGKKDAKVINDALQLLLKKFVKSGNASLKTPDGEFVLSMTKDMKELQFSMFSGNRQTYLANFVPSEEAVAAYRRRYM